MAILKHPHTYMRSKENMEIYQCIHPQCSHFTRRALIVGKEICCAVCHQLTLARNEQLHAGQKKIGVRKLTCILCSNSPKKNEILALEDVLGELLKESEEGKEEETKSA